MGDFNINLINYQNHHLTGQLLIGLRLKLVMSQILRTNAFMKCIQRFITIASLSRRRLESRGALKNRG